MIEFLFGTKAQFSQLDQSLAEGKSYKFDQRRLPDGCIPDTACLWFGKDNGVYRVCISKGITTDQEDPVFRAFLERGEVRFVSLDDMRAFFRSLRPYFKEPQADAPRRLNDDSPEGMMTATSVTMPEPVRACARSLEMSSVVDKEKLRVIQENDVRPKRVWPEKLAEPLKKKVFGQDDVIEDIADLVVINQMRKERKLLPILFLGPTATGKTETAKSLAQVMTDVYETPYGFIEIAGNELEGEQSIHRFLGAPPGYVGHGQPTLLDPVRENPYHVIVINEIEKADEKILLGLMEAIDSGKLGMADNSRPIELKHCVVLFTSNLPIDMDKYKAYSRFERAEMCRDAFTRFCGRPEISGKIGNFVAFNPLSDEAVTDIIIKFVNEVLQSFDMYLGHIDEYLMADFLKRRTKYGARGIRDLVEGAVGRHILKMRDIDAFNNKKIALKGTIDNIVFEIE